MKKLSFFLMAMLVSMTSFAAALGEGYSKVTDITTLSAGDKVVLYCDDAEKGVTGWDGTKTATAAADGWVEYVVEAADGGVLLKDGEQYIALTAKNGFYYTATGSVCKVTADGLLCITLEADGKDYMLYENSNNGNPLYRMYVDKSSDDRYKPVYVYEVVAEEEVPVVTKEEKTTCVPGTLADGKVTHDLPCCVIVQEQGESTTALKSVAPWEAPAKSIMTITPKEGVTILTYVINTKNTTLGTYLGKSELTNATKTATNNGLVTFTVTNGIEPVVMKFSSTTIKFHEITFTYTVAGGTEPVMYTVTVAAENGTVEGAGEYAENAEATLTATPAEGYEFVNWTVDGAEVSTENPYTFVVTANVALVANFKAVVVEEPLPEGVPTQEELWASFQTAAGLSLGTLSEIAASTNPVPCKVICTPLTATEVQKAFANAEWAWLKNYIKEVQNAQKGNPVASSTVPELTDDLTSATWRYAIAAFFLQTQYAAWPYSADFTEAGKPQVWGPYYLAGQTPVEPEPTTETVYFINNKGWSKVNAYAWDPQNANWPGVAATKEAEQIGGYDVYSYTADAGKYANVIFNNGSGQQTADLKWTAGKYVINNKWYTKEEAEAQLVKPVEYEYVYFVNAQGWAKVNIYTWTPEVGGWPGVAMTKEAEQLAGYDVYSYKVEKGTSFGGMLFNNTTGAQTGDLKWTAGKYYVKDGWYTKEEAEAKLAGPVTPPVITYVLMGVAGDWTTGIALTQNADNANEYVLLGQDIAEGDAVKVVTLTDGVATAWCGNVDEYSVAHSADDMGNIVLAPGKYDFYYKVAEDLIYIAAVAPAVEPCTEAIAVNWDEPIALQANADVWYYLNLATAVEGGNDISVLLVNTSDEETEITVAAYEDCPGLEIITEVTKTLKPNEKLDGIAEYAEYLDGQVSEMYIHVTTKGGAVEVSAEAIEPLEIMPIEMTNLEVQDMGEFVLLQASDLNMTGISVVLGVYADGHLHEGSAVDWNGTELPIVEGNITKTVDAEKGDVYAGLVVVEFGEGKMGLDLTMYSAAVEAVEVAIEGAQVAVNENTGTLEFTATWEGYPVLVTVAGYEDVEFKEYEGAQISELTIGDDDNWYDFAVADVVAVIKDGNTVSLEGEYTSWATGATYYVMIDGELPAVVDPVKPEPTYTENALNTYAFGLESVLSEDAATLTVTYRLNNSNATSVNVVVYNGDEVVATVPGTTTIGVNTVEVATADLPAGVELTWAVEVNGTSVEVPTQETKMYSMYCPHGLAIDKDPESEYFGRILVADAMSVVKDKAGYLGSGIGAGLHAFNPSFTTDSTVYTGGNDFTRILASNGYQPWRVKISEDGRIFVSSLDLNGVVVWEVSKDLQTWTPVIAGTNDATDHNIYDAEGNFIAGLNCSMDVIGSGEDLKLLLYSTNNKGIAFNQSGYRLDEYALGTATTWTGLPKNILEGGKLGVVHTNVEFIYDGEGGYWFGASRAGNAGQPNLVHINAAGEQDYYTEDASLYGGDGVLLHNGMLFKGKARTSGTVGNFGVWTVGKDADGKVTLTEKWSVVANGIGRNLNEFAVDYAENLYVVGNSGEKIIAYALPYSGQVVTPAASQYAFELEAAPAVEVMELTMTNLSVQNYGDATGLWASDMDNGIEVMLFLDAEGNLMEESSIMVGWMDYPVTGTVEVSYSEELATDVYYAELYTTVGETNYKLIITMYYVPVEATPVVVENATIDDQTETSGFMYMYGEWTDADGLVYPVSAEVPGFDATVAEAVYSNVTVTVGGWGDEDPWLGFVQGDATITVVDDVVTLVGTMSSWDGLVLDVTISGTLPAVVEPVEMVGVVKRAVQNGDAVIVLTHEENGAAHIYEVVNGVAVAEISQEGVIAVDAENPGSYLAISDIAVTEDGKLVANNYIRCSFNDGVVESGYKRGTLTFYIWEDLAAAPAIWFQSKASSNSNNSDQGYTMAVTGTSTNANILVSGVHNTQRGVRMSHFSIVDGVYEDTQDGSANLPYYYYVGSNFKGASAGVDAAVFNEQTHGANIQFHASPLTPENWIIDGELTNPIEFINPQTHGGEVVINATLSEDLGNVYNGATYVTVEDQVLMVAPFANPDGQLVGVEILNITNGLEAAQYVDMVYVDEAVAATAAATAVEVVEGGLNITLVADNAIHTWFVELNAGGDWEVYEDEITNLVIDLDNLVLIGGPSTAFQVDVFLGLGEYNRNDDTYQLLPESSIAVFGQDATFIEGYAYEVDAFTPSAKAVVRCEWNGMKLEFHLTMTAEPMEATVVVVENATVEVEKYLLFGDMYDYALKMTGEWVNPEDGLTYPVLVEVPVYYPEATEPSEIMSTVTVGGWGDNDPWLGFGEGTLTVTTVDGVVTATGIVQNPMAGVAIDITISGKLPVVEPVKYTVTATVNPAEAGTVAGAGEYEENAEATLIATAAEGYEFVNWTVAGEEVSTDATYTFTVTADVEVVANFKEAVGTGVTNIQTGAKAVKTIKNGQLIINHDGKEYNAQGAIVK